MFKNASAMFPRFHLFEIEDFPWLPKVWRNLMTDYLRFLQEQLGLYDAALDLLQDLRSRGHADKIIDLCSGSGGPVLHLIDRMEQTDGPISVTLTDKYPPLTKASWNKIGKDQNVSYLSEPVDARNVPIDLIGFRTLFTSFHHFKPSDALCILKNASASGIAIFEVSERSIFGFVRVAALSLAAPFLVFFIRPFSWSRILWTIVPVIPMLTFWDGIVSHLRSYTVEELQQLLNDSGCAERGRVGKVGGGLCAQMTYLIIDPERREGLETRQPLPKLPLR